MHIVAIDNYGINNVINESKVLHLVDATRRFSNCARPATEKTKWRPFFCDQPDFVKKCPKFPSPYFTVKSTDEVDCTLNQ